MRKIPCREMTNGRSRKDLVGTNQVVKHPDTTPTNSYSHMETVVSINETISPNVESGGEKWRVMKSLKGRHEAQISSIKISGRGCAR